MQSWTTGAMTRGGHMLEMWRAARRVLDGLDGGRVFLTGIWIAMRGRTGFCRW